MQLLYMIESSGEQKLFKDPVVELKKQFDKTNATFIFLLHTVAEVARYAEQDAVNRANKNLPSAEDLQVNTKIAGNTIIWHMLENESYKKSVEQFKPHHITDVDLVRKLYQQLVEKDEYLQYISLQSREKKNEKSIIEFIFNELMLPNQIFIDYVEEHFNNWDDDGEMLQQLVTNYLSKPKQDLSDLLGDDKWQFAKNLLLTTIEKKDLHLELIKPKLQNWDSERIALLDMILMQMGIAELLYFETIPTKVTINEYIDLAKEYSTPQSGQFVNGLLDNIHKDLLQAGKIHKIEYKKN